MADVVVCHAGLCDGFQAAQAHTPTKVIASQLNPAAMTMPSRVVNEGTSVSEHRRLILPVLAFAQFISAMDYNIVYVALPEIGRALGFSAHTLQWVVSAYAVAF